MRLRPAAQFSLIIALLLPFGCKGSGGADAKEAILAAKERHGPALATMAAFVPFLDFPEGKKSTAVERAAGEYARKQIVDATSAYLVQKDMKVADDAPPWDKIGPRIGSLHATCAQKWGEPLQSCFSDVKLLELLMLDKLHDKATEAGLPPDTVPEALAGWITPEAKAKAALLDAIVKAPDSSAKIVKLWDDPQATFDSLDAACKEATATSKDDAAKPAGGPEDPSLAKVRNAGAVEMIGRCANLLSYALAQKILGSCLGEKPDANCFNERSCQFVKGIRDGLDGKKGKIGEDDPKDPGMPVALNASAQQMVELCKSHM